MGSSLVDRFGSELERVGFDTDQVEALTAAPPVVVLEALREVVGVPESPVNAVTGAAYRGKNIDRLLLAEAQAGYGPGGWAGFKQWLSVGRVVRKGEHGTACITVMTSGTPGSAEASAELTSSEKRKPVGGVRGFRVFHFDQTCELGEVPTA